MVLPLAAVVRRTGQRLAIAHSYVGNVYNSVHTPKAQSAAWRTKIQLTSTNSSGLAKEAAKTLETGVVRVHTSLIVRTKMRS